MNYPSADDPSRVGQWPALTKSGAGHFYDHVLEYRVWVHPELGGPDEFDGEDYFYAFATHEEAAEFSSKTPGAEAPLVLVRQLEWIDEPKPGEFIHEKSARITEWQPEWLASSRRKPNSIEQFLREQRSV